ncbi:hypothetical protein LI019_01825 [Enterocloster bolteae]|jgi:hypothetical protein|uniref:hypothetical protein n=1 Tax=Clostridia TaxID=186801 RepID=UPI00189DC1AB|nr:MULTISPECIES: hypothetical protein [Clostridia]MCB7087660.1 hypothetical protein [Enterocloster bolteae]MCH1937265.1 hypothetical protein [Enterocloster sp. OA11]
MGFTRLVYITKAKISLVDILEYILITLVITTTGAIWFRYGFLWSVFTYIKLSLLAVAILIIYLESILYAPKLGRRFIRYSVFYTICMSVYMLGNWNTFFYAFTWVYVPLMVFLVLSGVLTWNAIIEFWNKYIRIMVVIACCSLFFWLFGSVLKIISSAGSVTFEWDWIRTATSYHNLYYEPQTINFIFFKGIRNCAFFTEAPMYAFLLSTAYIIQRCYLVENRIITIILFITIITTFSTTAIIAVLLFEGLDFIMKKNSNKLLNSVKPLLLPFAFAIVVGTIAFMIMDKTTTGSYNVRTDHLFGCLVLFIKSFPWGIGFGNRNLIIEQLRYQQGLSVGIPYFIAMGGLSALLIFFIPCLFYLISAVKRKRWKNVAFVMTFFWIFMCTNVVLTSVLQWIIMSFVFVKDSGCIDF